MNNLIKNISAFFISFGLIYGCLLLGRLVAKYLPFTFPESIIGLIILFLLLETKILKLEWITPAGNLLMKHMAFLFIPAAVGMVSFLNEVYQSATVILLNVFLGIVFIILVVGRAFQHLAETPEERKHRKYIYKRAKHIRVIKKSPPKLSKNHSNKTMAAKQKDITLNTNNEGEQA